MQENKKLTLIYGIAITIAGIGCAAVVHFMTSSRRISSHQQSPSTKPIAASHENISVNSSKHVDTKNLKRLATINETSNAQEYFNKNSEGTTLHHALELYSHGILDKESLDKVRLKMRENPDLFFKEIQYGLNRIPLDGHDLERSLLIQWAAETKTDIKSKTNLLERELSYVITRDLNAKGDNYPNSSLVAFDELMNITPSKQDVQKRLVETIITLPIHSAATSALIARYATKDPTGASQLQKNLPRVIQEATNNGQATKVVEKFLEQVDAEAAEKYRQIAQSSGHNEK